MGLKNEIPNVLDSTPAVVTLTQNTPTQLSTAKSAAKEGLVFTADPGNTSPIYLGKDNTVTATAGWFAIIQPAYGPVLLPIKDASQIWMFSAGVSQKFGWVSL